MTPSPEGENNTMGSSRIPMPYYSPIDGLALARIILRDDEQEEYAWYQVVQDTMSPLFTIPPESIPVVFRAKLRSKGKSETRADNQEIEDSEIRLINTPMPFGLVPKPMFLEVVMNVLHALARLRWQASFKGYAYMAHRIAVGSAGASRLTDLIEHLHKYASIIMSNVYARSVVTHYVGDELEIHGATGSLQNFLYQNQDDNNGFNVIDNPIMQVLADESVYWMMYSELLGLKPGQLASRFLSLRDLTLMLVLLGNHDLLVFDRKHRQAVSINSAKQSTIDYLTTVEIGGEPLTLLYDLLMGSPTSPALMVLVAHFSRVYGGGLWRNVPRLFSPHMVTDEGIVKSIDKFSEMMESTPLKDPGKAAIGPVETSLLVTAIDIFTNTIFLSPWERSAALTIYMRGLAHLLQDATRNYEVHPAINVVLRNLLLQEDRPKDLLVLPLGARIVEDEGVRAITYKIPVAETIEEIRNIAVRLQEVDEETANRYANILRQKIGKHTTEKRKEIKNAVIPILYDDRLEDKNKWFRGIIFEVIHPLVDLFPIPNRLNDIIALTPPEKRRILPIIIDRITEPEYAHVMLYVVVNSRRLLNARQEDKGEPTSMRGVLEALLEDEFYVHLSYAIHQALRIHDSEEE